ncbi:acyl-CoA thioesterase [Sphingomonas sp. Leaf357]|uniref:acyl-CoA thioesterase n=1 Tax=Sphingomonas sp. Leaf357 TaxID=1736350 RepID=UPI0006F1F3E6|nr:acyl-CoA thioesterase [Sphingomonas sp. Leaf357]KQS03893.1 acyl-CoA thioesterase [Sphingomonas sp. Leaf357]
MAAVTHSAGVVRLIDMIFPGDTNHHGTLFGGVALAHMDKVAFLAASRHGRAPFVTAASQRIDFTAPALKGELIEATGRIVRVGARSCDVEVELVAEALLSGERRLCTRGAFTLVAAKNDCGPLPPILPEPPAADDALHMMDMVFPPQTNHYGTLFGGDALRMLGKAAFIAATRHARAVMVMAASDRIDFRAPIREGEMIELIARVSMAGRSSLRVDVQLWSEDLLTAERRHAASAEFVMVAVGSDGRSRAISQRSGENNPAD